MKIKLDENLPVRLVPMLQRQGHDVDTVPEEHLAADRMQISGEQCVQRAGFLSLRIWIF